MPDTTTTTTSTTTNISSTLSSANSTYNDTVSKPSIFLGSSRVYVAGILMPTIAVSISCNFDKSPQATITLPADPRLFNIGNHDRVPVQIFVKETVAESPNYILMFEGFVANKSYLSVPSQREINLQCIAYSEAFVDTKVRFMSSIDEAFLATTPGESAVAQGVFVPGFAFPEVLFYNGLGLLTEENGKAAKQISCPTEYLANLMQFMEEAGTSHAACGRFNDSIVSKYFAMLAYNLRFSKRFCWLPYFDYPVNDKTTQEEADKNATTEASSSQSYAAAYVADGIKEQGGEECTMFPIMYGLKSDVVSQALTGMLQTCSQECTIYDLLKFLLEQVEYEFLVIPNPAFQSKTGTDEGEEIDKGRATKMAVDENGEVTEGGPTKNAESPCVELAKKSDEEKKKEVEGLQKKYSKDRNCDRMVNFCLKPMFDDTFPPKCNLIFRSQVMQLSTSIQHNQTPTRIQVSNFNAFGHLVQACGGQNNALALFGSCDFYPSKYFGKKMEDVMGGSDKTMNAGTRALISETLTKDEIHTGPWLAKNSAPSWISYAFLKDKGTEEDRRLREVRMRENYMRRQLMRAQILNRTMNVSCVFLPYVTCGFPAVVYDSVDTGFSFAGNVIAYEHQISAEGMSTTVVLNGVRLLAEAVQAEAEGKYPNPINCVHAITHNTTALGKVYAAILGTPGATVSGAEPIDWASVQSTYSGEIEDVKTSPQTNIYEAYKLQRRNVVTFEDYCSFMGLTVDPSGGTDEEGTTPTVLSNDWIQDRAEITVFQSVPLLQNILPVELEKKDAEKLEKEIKEEQEAIEKEQNSINEDKAALQAEDQQKIAELTAAGCTYSESDGKWYSTYDPDNPQQVSAYQSYETYMVSYNRKDQKLIDRQEAVDKRNEALSQKQTDLSKLKGQINKDLSKEKHQLFSASGSSTEIRTVLKSVADECRANNIY